MIRQECWIYIRNLAQAFQPVKVKMFLKKRQLRILKLMI